MTNARRVINEKARSKIPPISQAKRWKRERKRKVKLNEVDRVSAAGIVPPRLRSDFLFSAMIAPDGC
jgi:hypothetical protein